MFKMRIVARYLLKNSVKIMVIRSYPVISEFTIIYLRYTIFHSCCVVKKSTPIWVLINYMYKLSKLSCSTIQRGLMSSDM